MEALKPIRQPSEEVYINDVIILVQMTLALTRLEKILAARPPDAPPISLQDQIKYELKKIMGRAYGGDRLPEVVENWALLHGLVGLWQDDVRVNTQTISEAIVGLRSLIEWVGRNHGMSPADRALLLMVTYPLY